MDTERVISGKIFDVWKNNYPLLFNETNPNLSLNKNQKRNCPSKRQAQFRLDGYFHEINGVKKFKVEATPTLIINDEKFENPLNYKKLKKYLEKLI